MPPVYADGVSDTDPHHWLEPEPPSRLCARVSCGHPAIATLTADYGDRVMAVGPLSPLRTPPALDLCARHRDLLSAPDGWQLIRYAAER